MEKIRGDIFLNGNVANERDLVQMVSRHVLEPRTFRDDLNATRKTLLVTAAWKKGHEFNERHVIGYLEEIGLDAGWRGGYPTNIQNLGLYTAFERFIKAEPKLYAIYHEKQETIKALKLGYFVKNGDRLTRVFADFGEFRRLIPGLGFFDLFYSIDDEKDLDFFTRDLDLAALNAKVKAIRDLHRNAKARGLARRIGEDLNVMIEEDRALYAECRRIENQFFESSGIERSGLYLEQRAEMEGRILSSASIFIFGGRVYVLNNRLRFYRLAEVFERALAQGTNTYGVSAGSICQTDDFALNFEKQFKGGFLRAEDHGMGLVRGIWIFTHANDYRYIVRADESMLSMFAIRHFPQIVVGLSRNSILRVRKYRDDAKREFMRYVSYGTDPVLVFGVRGRATKLAEGDEIVIEGTRHFNGENMVYTRDEIRALEMKEQVRRLKSAGERTIGKLKRDGPKPR